MCSIIDQAVEQFSQYADRDAIVCAGKTWSYQQLKQAIDHWHKLIENEGIKPGTCVAIAGDYSLSTTALIIALAACRCIVVPLTSSNKNQQLEYLDIAEVRYLIEFGPLDEWTIEQRETSTHHPLIQTLTEQNKSGLILFSSGTTGKPKASLLDFDVFFSKFRSDRPGMKTLVFLLLDHIGGLNTLFAVLMQGGTLVTPDARDADTICRSIEQNNIELLPTSPTFLRMLLISGAHERFDLSSLKIITYGTEPMPESTLQALAAALPSIKLKQTYGLSELGIMSTRSKQSNSTLVKIGGDGFDYKIIDNILWIKSRSAMLGYLNHDDPFDEHGWFNTNDVVEIHGDYLKILGRQSEIINVGGEKVYPNEVESILLRDSNVADVTVSGKSNPVTGQIVVAKVSLVEQEESAAVNRRLRQLCSQHLERYKVPMMITVSLEAHHSERFKKIRG